MLLPFLLICSLISSIFSTQADLLPYERNYLACSKIETYFEYFVKTKDFDITQARYTFALEQRKLLKTQNSTKSFFFNETFSVKIDYIFGNGQRSAVHFQKFEDESGAFIDFQIPAQKGTFALSLSCSEDEEILVNYLAVIFFPTTARLKNIEFDSGYQLVSVPGYFSGTYAYYDTFVIFAVFFLENSRSQVEITLNECIGDVRLFHFRGNELDSYLKDHKSSSGFPGNLSNKYYVNLTDILNFFVVEALNGVSFQYSSPLKAMVRLTTKFVPTEEIRLPFLPSPRIKYNYNFPEVLLNFSKIRVLNDTLNASSGNLSIPFSNLSANSSDNNSFSNQTHAMQYKIIIAQDHLFLSIVAKCGISVFESIPKNGNFEKINTYYKEILPEYALDSGLFQATHNDTNRTFPGSNETRPQFKEQEGKINQTEKAQNGTDNNSRGFLMKNDSITNDSNVSQQDTNNFSEISSLGLKPFTLYDNGNELNLVVNLDTRDYYFITAVAYSLEHNDTYFYYDPILIKDSKFGEGQLMDIGVILIIVGAVAFSLIMIFCFYRCMKRYLNSTKRAKKEKSKKKKDKFSDQQKILFGKPNEQNLSDKVKQDRLSQILGPSDIKIAKVI